VLEVNDLEGTTPGTGTEGALHKKRCVQILSTSKHSVEDLGIPHTGSVGMVQVHTVYVREDENRSKVAEKQMNSSDLNDPRTAVPGISICSGSFIL
jgi:hypothetical protein